MLRRKEKQGDGRQYKNTVGFYKGGADINRSCTATGHN